MVFLFPGILFRRSFFSGKFHKHFDSGNGFERILWSLLLSIASLFLFCCFITIVNGSTHDSLGRLLNIGENDILSVFEEVYKNNFPKSFKNKNALQEIFYILASLYVFSALAGLSLNRIVFIFGLEKKYPVLKFQNNWDYITVSNKNNNTNHKAGDVCYTKVDIKTNDGQLFTGRLHEIILDKEGKIEAITVQEAYKFYKLSKSDESDKIEEIKAQISETNPLLFEHAETADLYIYRKRIKGNLFTVFQEKIDNISITYVKISHIYETIQKAFKITVSVLISLSILFSISYGIWDYHIIPFATIFKRIGFCFMIPITLISLILCIAEIVSPNQQTGNKKLWIRIRDSLLIFIYILLPYLYIFDYIKFKFLPFIMLAGAYILGKILSKSTSDKPENEIESQN